MKKDYAGLDITVWYFTERDIVTLSASELDSQEQGSSDSYGNDLIGKDIFKD